MKNPNEVNKTQNGIEKNIKKTSSSKTKKKNKKTVGNPLEDKGFVEIVNKNKEKELTTWEAIKQNTHDYFYVRRFIPKYFAWKAGMVLFLVGLFIALRVITSFVILRGNNPLSLNHGIPLADNTAGVSAAIAVAYNNGLFFGISSSDDLEWLVWLSGGVIIFAAFVAIIFVESRSLFFFIGLFLVGAFSNYFDRIIFREGGQPAVIDYIYLNFNQILNTDFFSGASISNPADFLIVISLLAAWLIFIIKLFTGEKKKEISKKNKEINARLNNTKTEVQK